MSSNAGNGKLVCVTGASGYVASWLVKILLLRGYTVNATVRDPNDPKKVDHLLNLDGAKERLHLFKADLLEKGSFDPAVEGCEGVFHAASPCQFDVKDPQTELVDPAVKGTLNLLKSSRFCREARLWYALSKTLAEEAAWKFVKENSIDMVVIHPGVVLGPLLQPSLNDSSATVLKIVTGAQTSPNLAVGWINVKDVANAHIQAFEISSASGRYCLVETMAHFSDIVKISHELYPTLPLPEKFVMDEPLTPKFQVSKEKAKTLGIEFIPLEVSLKEIVESLEEKKLLNF
ncbi:hypothetical protein K1719_044314 [Acacia pycnantha]|nr:hypothetical protein K1719_044314 [Acacia pycnantha]